MTKYIIDVNLPDHFSLWHTDDYTYVKDIDVTWMDTTIWEYAEHRNLTIVTKDRDFYNRMLIKTPPPKVIHVRCGNLRIRDFYRLMPQIWPEALELSERNKLVIVYNDRIEAME